MEDESDEKKKSRTNPPASLLTDDLVVEILSRLPARSVHRFRCVARSWRDLITHPAHRKKLPQTLAGFFYGTYHRDRRPRTSRRFADVSGAGPHPPVVGPSVPFLPKYRDVDQLDTCNGLLLCRCYKTPSDNEFDYVVCNPATERWVELPPCSTPEQGGLICTTGAWNRRESGWDENTILPIGIRSIFVNGMLHLITSESVLVAVDTEGKAWRTVHVPRSPCLGSIGLSQGCLHYVSKIPASKIAVWCLEDYDSEEWVLKFSVSTEELFGGTGQVYSVTAIHPDCDIIFLVSWGATTLASYDMRRQEFRCIFDLEEGSTGPFLPYVPLFSESVADGV